MNKYQRAIAQWAYEPILLDHVADVVQRWIQEKEQYARGLDNKQIVLMLQDCRDALVADDLASLPDEWLAMFLMGDMIYSVKRGGHFLYAEARRAVMEEVKERAVVWAWGAPEAKAA